MIDTFEVAFQKLLKHEGGFVSHPADKGGSTKYGITLKQFNLYRKRGFFQGAEEVGNIDIGQARIYYLMNFWERLALHRIDSPAVAIEIFDTAVNMGAMAAIRIAQKTLNYLGENLVVDGLLGPLSLAAINHWSRRDKEALFICLNGFQFMRYVEIVSKNPSQKAFARGWTKRIQQYNKVGYQE